MVVVPPAGLPPHWCSAVSNRTGRTYYWSKRTGTSVWTVEDAWKTYKKEKEEQRRKRKISDSQDEPMEIEYADELRAFRMNNICLPDVDDPRGNASSSLADARLVVVFDTSAIISEPRIIVRCLEDAVTVVLPYMVICELDGLKKSGNPELVHDVGECHRYLDEYSKQGNKYLVLESSKEANETMSSFPCTCNDDRILKCALRLAQRNIDALFVTNDRNLSVKARGNGLICENTQGLAARLRDDKTTHKKSKKAPPVARSAPAPTRKAPAPKKPLPQKPPSNHAKKEKESQLDQFERFLLQTPRVIQQRANDVRETAESRRQAVADMITLKEASEELCAKREKESLRDFLKLLTDLTGAYVQGPSCLNLSVDAVCSELEARGVGGDRFYRVISDFSSGIDHLPLSIS